MPGGKAGVSTRIKAGGTRAIFTHCYQHVYSVTTAKAIKLILLFGDAVSAMSC